MNGTNYLEKPDSAITSEEIEQIAAKAIRDGMGTCANIITMELLRATYVPVVMSHMGQGIIGYIAAAGALAFSGRDITEDGITDLIRAVGKEPNVDYLDAISKLNYKNDLIYVNAVYFAKANGKEPTIDLVVEIVRSMGVPPDHRIAGYVIEYSREYLQGSYNFISTKMSQGGADEKFFKKLYLGMVDLSNDMSELAIRELNSVIEASAAHSAIGPEALPYLTAIGSLAFAGREMTIDNISLLIKSIGIEPQTRLLKELEPLQFKNPVIYIIALYYLYSMDLQLNSDSMCRIARALGADPDQIISDSVLAYYKSKASSHV
jgi:hypothetical protein